MLNNFTPSSKELAWWKVMQSPDLLAILKRMEGDDHYRIYSSKSGKYIRMALGQFVMTNWRVSIRNLRTLIGAELIAPVEYDDYIEYRLTYTGTFEELVRGGKNE